MALKYKIDVLEALKNKGYTSYRIRTEKIFGERQMQQLRNGEIVSHACISKLCELLNQREFLPYFPMLKDREKRIEQDEIWKKICEELNWEFIPTI